MEQDQYYFVGNTKQATLLLKEILPALQTIILNANKDFFTIKETMQMLSISRTQLYYLRVRGVLECKKVGRKVYITRQAINNLILNGAQMTVVY
jgi:hypothetical protein